MTYTLPSNKRDLAAAIMKHVNREKDRMVYHRLMWYLAWHYLNGSREFRNYNPGTGQYESFFVDSDGKLEFQSQTLLKELDSALSILNGINTMPYVAPLDGSLSRMRERAAAQILLDSTLSEDQVDRAKRNFNFMLLTYGMAGIQGHIMDHPTIGIGADMEAIHPRELMPFPSLGYDHTKASGLVRDRVYTMDWLESRGINITPSMKKEMEWWEAEPGSQETVDKEEDRIPLVRYSRPASATRTSSDNVTSVARVVQLWLDGPKGTCSRYVVISGDCVLMDKDLSKAEHYCPIGIRRCIETGSWHGAGYFAMMYGVHRQFEWLMKSCFANARDNDRFGVLVLPAGAYNERNLLTNTQEGLRVLTYTPDPITPDAKPFAIAPVNSGELPGKVAEMAAQILQGLSPVRDLANEKGRIDSAQALQTLENSLNRGLTNSTQAVEGAFADAYRSLCNRIAQQLTISPRTVPVSRLSLDLAGAVIDPMDNTVKFPSNPLSDVSRLRFAVREPYSGSKVAQKMELIQHFNEGRTDPDSFKKYAIENGIDLAMDVSDEEAALETVTLNCLLLFGDGETPGEIVLTPNMARPDLQLRIVNTFMSHPRMAKASVDVQDAFADFQEFLKGMMGMVPMVGAPNPDDLMAMAQGAPEEAPELPSSKGPKK